MKNLIIKADENGAVIHFKGKQIRVEWPKKERLIISKKLKQAQQDESNMILYGTTKP